MFFAAEARVEFHFFFLWWWWWWGKEREMVGYKKVLELEDEMRAPQRMEGRASGWTKKVAEVQ